MHLMTGIRERMHNFIRKKKLSKRQIPARKTCGLSKAAKVGIVFRYSTADVNKKIVQLAESLKQKNIKTDLLAYIAKPDKKNAHMQLKVPHFTNKDLNWFWFPKSRPLLEFVNKDYDILISLCSEKCIPIETVAALSKAGFRVGSYHNRSVACYDFMIDSNYKKQTDKLLEEIIHYLNMIQT